MPAQLWSSLPSTSLLLLALALGTGCSSSDKETGSTGGGASTVGTTSAGGGSTSGATTGSSSGCATGQLCIPADVCHLGTIDCATGTAACEDDGAPNQIANGEGCGDGGLCNDGACVTCAAGASCTPSNLCDLGSTVCAAGSSGVCADTDLPNPAQNGVTCSAGQVCASGKCVAPGGTSTSGGGGGPVWQLVPNQGGSVIATPNLVFITYDDDPNQAALQQYGVWIADGGYLPLVAGQYGLGNGTAQFVNVASSTPAPTGTTTNGQAFPAYLQALLDAQTIPAYAPGNLYVLLLPATWDDTFAFCQTAGGYHTYFNDSAGDYVPYAVVPNCLGTSAGFLQEIEVATSHEVVEGTTDPLIDGWVIQDDSNPWVYLGGEVGDLCESNSTVYNSGQFVAQLIWSNDAAADGGAPCQPWPSSLPYFSLVTPTAMASAPAGGQAQITLTGWASGGSDELFKLQSGVFGGSFTTPFALESSTLTSGATTTLTFDVPATAQSGQYEVALVIAQSVFGGADMGAAVVGVTVQ